MRRTQAADVAERPALFPSPLRITHHGRGTSSTTGPPVPAAFLLPTNSAMRMRAAAGLARRRVHSAHQVACTSAPYFFRKDPGQRTRAAAVLIKELYPGCFQRPSGRQTVGCPKGGALLSEFRASDVFTAKTVRRSQSAARHIRSARAAGIPRMRLALLGNTSGTLQRIELIIFIQGANHQRQH
jgi:hypothetical protein